MAIFSKEFLEILDEDVVYKNINDPQKLFISIDFSDGYGAALAIDPYFKVYKGKSYEEAKEDIRFYLRDGHSDKHTDGKKKLKVNNNILDTVANMLQSPTTNKKYAGLTTYDAIWKIIRDYAEPRKIEYLDYIEIGEFIRRMNEKNRK